MRAVLERVEQSDTDLGLAELGVRADAASPVQVPAAFLVPPDVFAVPAATGPFLPTAPRVEASRADDPPSDPAHDAASTARADDQD